MLGDWEFWPIVSDLNNEQANRFWHDVNLCDPYDADEPDAPWNWRNIMGAVGIQEARILHIASEGSIGTACFLSQLST